MSFTTNETGKVYAPGYFLASAECVRRTVNVAATGEAVTTASNGTKAVEMGTVYPSNDGNAEGIIYEDVDVTTGAMPGSLVVSGKIYKNRLKKTGDSYSEASTITKADSPQTKGWYEKSGDEYSASSDTVASKDKTYYSRSGSSPNYVYTAVGTVIYGDNPKALGLYERSGSSPNYAYTLSTDTQAAAAKTYYSRSDVTIASAAQSALEGKGFIFETEPTVTRP